MNLRHLLEHLRERVSLHSNLEQELYSRFREMRILKGSLILYPGEICKYVYYLHSGFFRIYRLTHDFEETIGFFGPGHLCTSIQGFLTQKHMQEGIICEEDALVFRLSYHDWLALEDISVEFLNLSKYILQEYLLLLNAEKGIYRTQNATQKYVHLCSQYKGIANLVSQKNIASYLGITAPTLSNLIKCLLRKRI